MVRVAYPITCGECGRTLHRADTYLLMFGELICRGCHQWTGYFDDEVVNG